MLKMLALIGFAACTATAQVRQPDPWWPPQPQSLCWTAYTECQFWVYSAHQNGDITDEQLTRLLEECKIGLGACALYEWIRRHFDPQTAAAYLDAIDPQTAAELAELFETEK